MATKKKTGPKEKPGPKANTDLMELAVQLRLRGLNWLQVSRLARVPYRTLMDWQKTTEWEALREKVASGAAGRLTHVSFELLAEMVVAELGKKGKRDPSLAKWWIEHSARRNGDDEGGFGGLSGPGVVFLPMQNRGLESRPATQVLLPPEASRPAPQTPEKKDISTRLKSDKNPVKTPRPKPGARRRVAGPDE